MESIEEKNKVINIPIEKLKKGNQFSCNGKFGIGWIWEVVRVFKSCIKVKSTVWSGYTQEKRTIKFKDYPNGVYYVI